MTLGRWTRIGAVVGGAIGGIVGLVVGLEVNPATAWFAVFEVGIPCAMAGALLGCVLGAVFAFGRRLERVANRFAPVPHTERNG